MARSNKPEMVTMWRLTAHFRHIGDSTLWTMHSRDREPLKQHYDALLALMQKNDDRGTEAIYLGEFIYTIEREDGSMTAIDAREISRMSLRSYETEERFAHG